MLNTWLNPKARYWKVKKSYFISMSLSEWKRKYTNSLFVLGSRRKGNPGE